MIISLRNGIEESIKFVHTHANPQKVILITAPDEVSLEYFVGGTNYIFILLIGKLRPVTSLISTMAPPTFTKETENNQYRSGIT